jgi:hypothetical protein
MAGDTENLLCQHQPAARVHARWRVVCRQNMPIARGE